MCSCGGLLTGWCYECGDEICPHCGCLTDHERDDADCGDCGHPHAGAMLGYICVGCPCPRTGPPWHQSPCRAGCPTQDHASWGHCARDARIGIDREALRP